MHEWANAEAAPLYRWAPPSSHLVDALRELDDTTQRLRLEHPEWFPDDMPGPRDRDAFERWIDEREEQQRGQAGIGEEFRQRQRRSGWARARWWQWVVASVAGLGLVAGLAGVPFGLLLHAQVLVPMTRTASGTGIPPGFVDVIAHWQLPLLTLAEVLQAE